MLKQPELEQATQRTAPYCYYSYEQWGRGYIGSRTAKGCHPGDDYLGSYSDETFKPTDKIILFTGTAEECLAVEVKLHAFFDVVLDPHYANRARQTSTGFTTAGIEYSDEYLEKQRAAQTGKRRTPEQCEKIKANWDKRGNRKEKHKEKMSARWKNGKAEWQTKGAITQRVNAGWTEALMLDAYNGTRDELAERHGVSFKTVKHIRAWLAKGKTVEDALG